LLVHIRAAKEYRDKYPRDPRKSDMDGFGWHVTQYLAYAE